MHRYLLLLSLTACTGGGIDLLGGGSHSPDDVEITTIVDGLAGPTDLAFNPYADGELWIPNQDAESVTIVFDAGTADQSDEERYGPGGQHFLARPSSIAFGADGLFATAHDTDEKTQGPMGTPADFMGPTLWDSDLEIFDGGHAGHMDMVHNSPLGKGIAWEVDNVYWVYDGYHASLTRYDFAGDHGPGGSDHSDAVVSRFVDDQMSPHETLPSHLRMIDGLLYAADTAAGRIAVLDPTTGTEGSNIHPNYDGIDQHFVDDAELSTFIDGAALDEVQLEAPVGLDWDGELLFVTDNAAGRILAFDMIDGLLVDWLDVGGDLKGVAVGPDGDLWVVDGDAVKRISPL